MSAREPVIIGRYAAPTRRVLRSLNSGYQGDWQSWAGTPRQMRRLAEARRNPESAWWWSHAYAACAGAVITLLLVSL